MREDKMLLGLNLLSAIALPGVRYTQAEIAAWCDCTQGGIHMLERRAIHKLKRRLFLNSNKTLRELCEHERTR